MKSNVNRPLQPKRSREPTAILQNTDEADLPAANDPQATAAPRNIPYRGYPVVPWRYYRLVKYPSWCNHLKHLFFKSERRNNTKEINVYCSFCDTGKEGVIEAQNGSCSLNNLLIVDRWSLKVTHWQPVLFSNGVTKLMMTGRDFNFANNSLTELGVQNYTHFIIRRIPTEWTHTSLFW